MSTPGARERGRWNLTRVIIPSSHPCYRILLAIDIEGSTTRTNLAKGRLRSLMYDLVTEALVLNGIGRHHRDAYIDCGDGILALIHAVDQVPKTVLLSSVVPTLSRLVGWHNTNSPEDQLRLRVVLHAGEVHFDSRGQFGEALDVAFRLLDAPEVKLALRRTVAPLVLVISDELYRSVVRQGYDGIDPSGFAPLVPVRVGQVWRLGWLQVPDPFLKWTVEGRQVRPSTV